MGFVCLTAEDFIKDQSHYLCMRGIPTWKKIGKEQESWVVQSVRVRYFKIGFAHSICFANTFTKTLYSQKFILYWKSSQVHKGVKQAPDLIRNDGLIESLQELGKFEYEMHQTDSYNFIKKKTYNFTKS